MVGLCPAATLHRVRWLKESGVIRIISAELDPAQVGFPLQLYIMVTLARHDPRSTQIFEDQVRALPQIISADNVAGETDYLMVAVARKLTELAQVLASLSSRGGQRLSTHLRLSEVKPPSRLPLAMADPAAEELPPRPRRRSSQRDPSSFVIAGALVTGHGAGGAGMQNTRRMFVLPSRGPFSRTLALTGARAPQAAGTRRRGASRSRHPAVGQPLQRPWPRRGRCLCGGHQPGWPDRVRHRWQHWYRALPGQPVRHDCLPGEHRGPAMGPPVDDPGGTQDQAVSVVVSPGGGLVFVTGRPAAPVPGGSPRSPTAHRAPSSGPRLIRRLMVRMFPRWRSARTGRRFHHRNQIPQRRRVEERLPHDCLPRRHRRPLWIMATTAGAVSTRPPRSRSAPAAGRCSSPGPATGPQGEPESTTPLSLTAPPPGPGCG